MFPMFARKVMIPGQEKTFSTGWLPPFPDMRDYTPQQPEIKQMSDMLNLVPKIILPKKVDLRAWCSPIEDQGQLGSCTANAAVGVVEYFECRANDRYIDGSRLFIYKTTRNLMGVTGDTGAWLRNTMGALVLCGVAPEKYWLYTDKHPDFDSEPPAFVYAVAENFKTVKYFCHDPIGKNVPTKTVLNSIKTYLAGGVPSMFGFFGFPSFDSSNIKGGVPYPCPDERAQWGHAIVAVGYDDDIKVKNTLCNQESKGALLIRNSWGTGWGDAGYGWLPYDYVLNRLALDFWSLMSLDWVNTGQFGFQE